MTTSQCGTRIARSHSDDGRW